MNKTLTPRPGPGILDIAKYVPGDSGASASGPIYKLSSNETPLGASPKAISAFKSAAGTLNLYPDGGASRLREAIAAFYGLNPDHIVCGSGSDEILSLLAQAYLRAGDEAVISRHGFLMYEICARANGARPVFAAETDLTASVDHLLEALSDKTRMVFLANPNNPTGTYLPFDEVRRLHGALPDDVVLVLDAAYAEYVRRNDYEAGIELVANTANVVMTRTFSKIYGLAGLRLGWAYCPENIAAVLNRVRGPFNVSAPAIAAGVAALEDRGFTEQAVEHNARWLDWLRSEITALGLRVTPSAGNFLLIHFPDEPGRGAADADAFLSARGLILRRLENYRLPHCLRTSVGTDAANHALVDALRAFLAG